MERPVVIRRRQSRVNEEPPPEPDTHSYRARFWILAIFSFLSWFQGLQWNLWGSLTESVEAAFPSWGSQTVAMLANWSSITHTVCVVPIVWFMHTRGLRQSVLLCGTLVAVSTLLKVPFCVAGSNGILFTVVCHVSAILNGISGILTMTAPPMIAALWFPPHERTTATAVVQVLNQLGSAGTYLEPLVVRSPESGASPQQIKSDINHLLLFYAVVGTLTLLAIVIYYPDRPPTPPSLTSYIERLSFKDSLLKMLRSRDEMLVIASYSLCIAVPSCWVTVLNYNLKDLGMYQDEAMWVGLTAVVVQGVAGVAVGRLTDLIYGYAKLSLLAFLSASLLCFIWFMLLTLHVIEVTTWQVYVSVVGGLAFNFATAPLFFEVAVELSYPTPEVVVGGFLTGVMNVLGLLFYFLFFIPYIGYQWVTYVLVGSALLSILPLLLVREVYARSQIDRSALLPDCLVLPSDPDNLSIGFPSSYTLCAGPTSFSVTSPNRRGPPSPLLPPPPSSPLSPSPT